MQLLSRWDSCGTGRLAVSDGRKQRLACWRNRRDLGRVEDVLAGYGPLDHSGRSRASTGRQLAAVIGGPQRLGGVDDCVGVLSGTSRGEVVPLSTSRERQPGGKWVPLHRRLRTTAHGG